MVSILKNKENFTNMQYVKKVKTTTEQEAINNGIKISKNSIRNCNFFVANEVECTNCKSIFEFY